MYFEIADITASVTLLQGWGLVIGLVYSTAGAAGGIYHRGTNGLAAFSPFRAKRRINPHPARRRSLRAIRQKWQQGKQSGCSPCTYIADQH